MRAGLATGNECIGVAAVEAATTSDPPKNPAEWEARINHWRLVMANLIVVFQKPTPEAVMRAAEQARDNDSAMGRNAQSRDVYKALAWSEVGVVAYAQARDPERLKIRPGIDRNEVREAFEAFIRGRR